MSVIEKPHTRDYDYETVERPCHRGDRQTGKTVCGTKVTPNPHHPDECVAANHTLCVVCWPNGVPW